MQHPFDLLPLENGANLIFAPCPGTQAVDLSTALAQLAAAGAAAVLTLLPSEEIERNGVAELPHICNQLGMKWLHLPIEDDCAPEAPFEDAWQTHQANIQQLLDAGKSIAIHCKGGTGRTGMVAARILLARGLALEDVINRVRAVRSKALRIPVQMHYIETIAQANS